MRRSGDGADVYWLEGWTGRIWQVLRELHPEGETQVERDAEAIRLARGAIPARDRRRNQLRLKVERVLWQEGPKTWAWSRKKPGKRRPRCRTS